MTIAHPGTASATLTPAGGGVLSVKHLKSGLVWRIHQMAIRSFPVGNLSLETAVNGLPALSPKTVLSGACADGLPSLDLGDHDELTVTVTDGPANANVVLTYFYEELVESVA